MTVDQWVDLTRPMDLDGLEFYWPFTPAHDMLECRRLRQKVEAAGRSIPMMCCSPDFTQPNYRDRKREIARQRRVIEVSTVLGVKFCRVLSGQRRPEVGRSDGLAWVRECLEGLSPFAEKHGVVLVLENHYKDGFWDYPEFAQKRDLFLELLAGIPESPWFGVNYDPSNAVIAGEDPIELLEAVKSRVKTMHASDRTFEGGTIEDLRRLECHPRKGYASILKHGVIGKGLNDYDRIFSMLSQVGFQGWISIEDGSDPETGLEDIAESAIFLRAKMRAYGLS